MTSNCAKKGCNCDYRACTEHDERRNHLWERWTVNLPVGMVPLHAWPKRVKPQKNVKANLSGLVKTQHPQVIAHVRSGKLDWATHSWRTSAYTYMAQDLRLHWMRHMEPSSCGKKNNLSLGIITMGIRLKLNMSQANKRIEFGFASAQQTSAANKKFIFSESISFGQRDIYENWRLAFSVDIACSNSRLAN